MSVVDRCWRAGLVVDLNIGAGLEWRRAGAGDWWKGTGLCRWNGIGEVGL